MLNKPTAYLQGTSIEHCLSLTRQPIDLDLLDDVNVVMVFNDQERSVLLASVNPPNQMVNIYLDGDKQTITVQSLFNTIQRQAIAWCEI